MTGRQISIHAAREGGDVYGELYYPDTEISIHAAREGGDQEAVGAAGLCEISIHAAREGGDAEESAVLTDAEDFNPRRP